MDISVGSVIIVLAVLAITTHALVCLGVSIWLVCREIGIFLRWVKRQNHD